MSEPAKPPAYRPASRFVLRTPLLPFETIAAWASADLAVVRAALHGWLGDPVVREAVFVASPELDGQLADWHAQPDSPAGQAVERAIVRYVSRMAGRSTPFGLFSGVSVGTLGGRDQPTRLELAGRAAYRRHTRLDNDYLFEACADLAALPALRATLRYRPNTSLYRAAGRLRYAEARLGSAGRTYHLVAVDPSDYLVAVLERARGGATTGELADVLCADPDIAREEAEGFVQELIDTQLIVSDLRPAVTGREPTERMVEQLASHAAGAAASAALGDAARALAALDDGPPGAAPDAYRAIARDLGERLPTKVALGKMFQVDLVKPATAATLAPAVVAELTRGLELLRRLTPPGDEDGFARFRQAFSTRYETREVPLVEVLDEEAGIGFSDGDPGAGGAPLLADLPFPAKPEPRRVPVSARDAHLMRLVNEAIRAGATELELSDDDLAALTRPTPSVLSDTVSLGATIVAESAQAVDEGRFTVRLNGVDGGPGARMLGRFCHGSAEVAALTEETIAAEHALCTDDAVFAEIVHLPEGRIGNILLRPVLRPYEIVYLGDSGAPADRQILVTDLLVSIIGNRVVLRSRALGKRVIPRMTTAHNYSARSLGVYRFLCSLAQQEGRGAVWSWGVMNDAPFLPRVRRGRLILTRARWQLAAADLEPLAEAAKGKNAAKTPEQIRALRARQAAAVATLRRRRALPPWVVVADSDNELPVDLDNPLMVESFFDLVKGRTQVTLFELYPGQGELCVRGPEGSFVHEILLPFVRVAETRPPAAPRTTRPAAAPAAPAAPPVVRRFPPGSPWLYVRVFTGTATVDTLLREAIGPLVRAALADKLAAQWFFIRYGDPDWHLRLRFGGDPHVLVRELLPRVHDALAAAGDDGLHWKVELGTYEREVERYGGPAGIELAERWFGADSDAVLAIVEASSGDAGADAAWRLALRGIDRLLVDLGMDVAARRDAMTRARDGFGAEVGMDTAFQKRLGEKYRALRTVLADLLAAPDDAPDHPLGPGLEALAARSAASAPIFAELRRREAAGLLTAPITDLALSFAHMHANRLLASSARHQELVLYDLLRRHYDGVLARARGAGA